MEFPVQVLGVGLLTAAGIGRAGATGGSPGSVPGFRPRNYIADRKSLKLMSRGVRLGVSAVKLALEDAPGWEGTPPERRAFFVGASPQPGDPDDLRPALEAAMVDGVFSDRAFAQHGYPLIHPLWLLRGLSNNVLGFASAAFDLQGTNANYCEGEQSGWTALLEGAHAIAEGRADLAIAGGADSLVGAERFFDGQPCGEGAAFVVMGRLKPGQQPLVLRQDQIESTVHCLGRLGAATWPVAFARHFVQHCT